MQKALGAEQTAAAKQNLPTAHVLERLLEIEAVAYIERYIERRILDSKLPERKLSAAFDFRLQTGIGQRQVMELPPLGFVERKQWLISAGSSGTGMLIQQQISAGLE